MNKKAHIMIICLCILMLSACVKKENHTDIILDDFKKILTVQDTRLELYEGALNAVSEYINKPASDSLHTAQTVCTDAITQLLDLEEVTSTLDEKTKKEMIALPIDITDYIIPFRMQSYNKNNNIQTIMYLLYYLNKAPLLNEQLKYVVEFNVRYEALERKIDFLALNGLFVSLPDKATEDFRADFLPSLRSLSADNLPWEKDDKVIEAKANSLFLDMEGEILEYSDFVGSQYTDALILQQECENALIENGVMDNEAEKILEEINKLSEKSLKEQKDMLEDLPNSE